MFEEKIYTKAIAKVSGEKHPPHYRGEIPLNPSIPSSIFLDGLLLV